MRFAALHPNMARQERLIFVLDPFVDAKVGKLGAFGWNMCAMLCSLHPLNLLYKPFAKDLRIFNQFKAQRSRPLGSNQSILVFVYLGVQSANLEEHFT